MFPPPPSSSCGGHHHQLYIISGQKKPNIRVYITRELTRKLCQLLYFLSADLDNPAPAAAEEEARDAHYPFLLISVFYLEYRFLFFFAATFAVSSQW